MAFTRKYILDGLTCNHCADELERAVSQLDGVVSSSINFMTKTLTVIFSDDKHADRLSDIRSVIKRHASSVDLTENQVTQPRKKTLFLSGIDCPECARTIEEAASRVDGVRSVYLDFVSQRLTIEAEDDANLPATTRRVAQAAKEAMPSVSISYTDSAPEEKKSDRIAKYIRGAGFGMGAILFAAGLLYDFGMPGRLVVFLISYLLVGGEVLLAAFKNILNGQVFDENFLMGIATIGAFAIGEYPEGVAVMLFYRVGEAFQSLAVNRSRRAISSLMNERPDFANLKTEDGIKRVAPEEVGIGDFIVVKPGEKIPLDGRIVDGLSSLDTSAITGESLPWVAGPGDEALSGSINKTGLLTIEVSREFEESTISKILDLVQNAGSKKATTENFITKFARYYTPVVTFCALALALIPPLIIPEARFSDWIYRALVFLVVSCPCALVISIPLSFFGGIGGASRNGILVKGSSYLEALNSIDTVVFDKTGTLTRGVFTVIKTIGANGWSEEEILYHAAHAESFSNHPIALSIQKAYRKPIDPSRIESPEEIAGMGMRVLVDGRQVLAGNAKLLESEGISVKSANEPGSVVHLAVGGKYAGYIVISDELKPDSKKAVSSLKSLGVSRTVMLTGDSKASGEAFGRETGVDEIYSELLPHQKVEQLDILEKQKNTKGSLVFVGDGINDAPVLARADVGIAMGGLGSDAAIEAADIVLMTDEPSKLVSAIRIARKTRSIVWQNIIFALGVKAAILILAAFGVATMWEAVFGDVGVSLIAIINALRAMKLVK